MKSGAESPIQRDMIVTPIDKRSVLGLWLFFMPSKLLPISSEEQKWVKQLKANRGKQYHFSRGCVRHAMSSMTGLDPLEIPLKADPGQPPLLADGWGYISISHCSDALFIGWCKRKIGVDIEQKNRTFDAYKLSKRFFSESENLEIENLTPDQIKEKVLTRWTVKEAAIKWQNGKISNNLNQWIWLNNSSIAYHKKLGYRVKVYNQSYQKWTYAIAFNANNIIENPIICIN